MLKITHNIEISNWYIETSCPLDTFWSMRRCCAQYWMRKLIINFIQLWNLWTTLTSGLGRHVYWWNNNKIWVIMRITNSFLIGLKTCSQNYNPYQESVSGQEPVTRKVLGSRREPTTITLLDMALSPHLMTSSHQLMHFSKCIRKKILLSFSVNIKNLNTFRCRI